MTTDSNAASMTTEDATASLRTLRLASEKAHEAFIEKGRALHEIDGLSWSRIGAATGKSEKMAAYYFGSPEQVAAWKNRNREGARKRGEALRQTENRMVTA